MYCCNVEFVRLQHFELAYLAVIEFVLDFEVSHRLAVRVNNEGTPMEAGFNGEEFSLPRSVSSLKYVESMGEYRHS